MAQGWDLARCCRAGSAGPGDHGEKNSQPASVTHVRVQAFCRHALGITGPARNPPALVGAGGGGGRLGRVGCPGWVAAWAPWWRDGRFIGGRRQVSRTPAAEFGRVKVAFPGVVDSPGTARQGCRVHCPPEGGKQRHAVGVQPDASRAGAPAAAERKQRPARLKTAIRRRTGAPAGSPHCAGTGRKDAWPWRAGEDAVGGRHEAPKPGTDVFMAVVVLALLALLAAVVIPAALGG
jgi:hypothetical protein